MMTFNSLKPSALVSVAALAITLLIQASGGEANAKSADDIDPLVGVWNATVTATDCATGAALFSWSALSAVHQGGTWSAEGSVFGTWERKNSNTYTSHLIFTLYDASQNPTGYQKATATRTLGADGNSYTSTITRQTLDLSGNVVSQGCASEAATRVIW